MFFVVLVVFSHIGHDFVLEVSLRPSRRRAYAGSVFFSVSCCIVLVASCRRSCNAIDIGAQSYTATHSATSARFCSCIPRQILLQHKHVNADWVASGCMLHSFFPVVQPAGVSGQPLELEQASSFAAKVHITTIHMCVAELTCSGDDGQFYL